MADVADLTSELIDYFRQHAVLGVLLGAGIDCRVYPDTLKQGVGLPAVVFTEVAGESIEHLGGPAGLVHATLDVYSYGANRLEANRLDTLIRNELTPFNGIMGGLEVTEINCVTARQYGVDLPQDGSDQKRYWTQRTYNVWHEEST